MATAPDPDPTVFLLLRGKDGRKRPTRSKIPVRDGELVQKLNEVIPPDQFSGEHNYRVYNAPYITLYCEATRVGLLVGAEPHYLMAVTHERRIREFHNHAKKEYILGLKTGDEISFRISPNSKAVRGRIRYTGPVHVERKKGVYFGMEIDKDDEYRGKGTTAGLPYFDCGHKNAVWVSMDMVIYTPGSTGQQPSCGSTASGSSSSHSDQRIVCDSSKSPVANRRAPRDSASSNTHPNSTFKMASKVFNYLKPEGGKSQHSTLYKKGDRVVVYSMKDQRPITATVCWTGLVQMSKKSGLPPMIFAGLEPDFMIVPEVEFPDTHIDLAGYQLAQFEVERDHTKLYIPEQLLVPEADYKKQKEQKKIAEELEVSVSYPIVGELKGVDIKKQQKIIDEANAQHTAKLPQNGPIQNNEDTLTTAAGEGALQYPGQAQRVQSYQHQDSGSRPGMDHDRQHHHEQQHHDQAFSQHYHQRSSPNLAVKLPVYHDTKRDISASSHSPSHSHQPFHAMQNRPVNHHHNNNLPIPAPRRSAVEKKKQQQQEEEMPSWLTMDTVVVVRNATLSKPVTGTVRFIGRVEGYNELVAGLVLDEIMEGCGNGVFGNERYFICPDGKAYFCRICDLQSLDSLCSPTPPATGGAPPPTVPVSTGGGGTSYTNPLAKYPCYEHDDQMAGPELFNQYIGNERGIQGHHNSCYLDSTVFGLFALSDAFDMMFLSEDKESQSLAVSSIQEEEYCKRTKQILWKGIVIPLRKHGVARYETVMELRDYLEQLESMAGANKDEKDPEEFLNMLFKKVLHVPPFISIKRPFGIEKNYFVQLFFELDPKQKILPFTEVLLCKMFEEQNMSFTEIPSKLLLQMPRFGKNYNRILPSLTLDVASIVDSTKPCMVPATVSCTQCAQTVFRVNEKEVALCDSCSKKIHSTLITQHNPVDVTMFSKMELLSVICIDTSHYVCFTRCGDRWLFHDSMADRVYDMYNIPRVTEVTEELNEWMYSGNVDRLMSSRSHQIPECVRRFTQDGYMCIYVNPDLEMYGPVPKFSDHQMQDLPASQQTKIENLTRDLFVLQQDKMNMEAVLTEKLRSEEQKVSRSQYQLSSMATEIQQQAQCFQEEKTHLQEEVRQLQSIIEQQPKLGTDSDISFWLVSHNEVHSSGEELGSGAWGRVTKGTFRGQKVAVKQLHSGIKSPYYDKLLRREISLMAKVRHPNLLLFIAAVLDKPGRSDPIIITELLDTSLRHAYTSGLITSKRVKVSVLRDVAAALNYLHLQKEPIIHRDVSSANVLLQALPDNKWRGKLSDFGSANLAKLATTPGPGAIVYCAPEAFIRGKQSPKADVFSYGKLFCEVYSSQFPDPDAFPFLLKSLAREWPIMHQPISDCVEEDPAKRPTMNSIVHQLNTFTK